MPIVTVRPNGTVALGNWSVVVAANAHTALSDNLDTTFVQNVNRCTLESQKLRLALGDVSLPAGAKIRSVRATARCGTITGGAVQPRCLLWFAQTVVENALTLNISRLIQAIFAFNCPRPPPAAPTTTWVLQQLEYRTVDTVGQEWTQAAVNAFELRLGRDNAGTNLRLAEVYCDVDYNERPVATATGPTGTTTDTTRPTITWTYADPESDPQASWMVRVFSDDQYLAAGFDPLTSPAYAESGSPVDPWVLGQDLQWTVSRDLVNDTYRAYVQVSQVWDGLGEHRSVVSFIGWIQNVPGPPQPLLTATHEPSLNRIRLDLAKGGTSPATETYNIDHSDDAGLSWAPVRGGVQVVAVGGDTAQLYDGEAPLNVARWYRVQAFRTLGSIKVASMFSATASAVPASRECWLKDPLAPTLNAVLPVAAGGDQPRRVRDQGVFKPLTAVGGTARAIAVLGPRYGREGTLKLVFDGADGADWAAFNALYDTRRTLLYQIPDGEQFYIALGAEVAWSWDLDLDPPSGGQPRVYYRIATVGYDEVAAP